MGRGKGQEGKENSSRSYFNATAAIANTPRTTTTELRIYTEYNLFCVAAATGRSRRNKIHKTGGIWLGRFHASGSLSKSGSRR